MVTTSKEAHKKLLTLSQEEVDKKRSYRAIKQTYVEVRQRRATLLSKYEKIKGTNIELEMLQEIKKLGVKLEEHRNRLMNVLKDYFKIDEEIEEITMMHDINRDSIYSGIDASSKLDKEAQLREEAKIASDLASMM